MTGLNLPESKIVLAFNPARILVGVFKSVRAAAELTASMPQGISNTCNGKVYTAAGFYWRHMHPDVEIETSDIGVLRIEEYDKLCGIDREYLPSRKIKGKRTLSLKNAKVIEYGSKN